MVYNYFLRALAATLILAQSYVSATSRAPIRQERPLRQEKDTKEITGPNGEPLWDFLFVQKPPVKPVPIPTEVNAPKEETQKIVENVDEILFELPAETSSHSVITPLEPAASEKTNQPTGIESMLPENTRWATPEEEKRFYDTLKMNTLDTTSPEAIESIKRMNTYQ